MVSVSVGAASAPANSAASYPCEQALPPPPLTGPSRSLIPGASVAPPGVASRLCRRLHHALPKLAKQSVFACASESNGARHSCGCPAAVSAKRGGLRGTAASSHDQCRTEMQPAAQASQSKRNRIVPGHGVSLWPRWQGPTSPGASALVQLVRAWSPHGPSRWEALYHGLSPLGSQA